MFKIIAPKKEDHLKFCLHGIIYVSLPTALLFFLVKHICNKIAYANIYIFLTMPK